MIMISNEFLIILREGGAHRYHYMTSAPKETLLPPPESVTAEGQHYPIPATLIITGDILTAAYTPVPCAEMGIYRYAGEAS